MKPSPRWHDWLIAFLIFALCLTLYNATLTPGLSYASPDGNELTTVAATLGLAHPTGYPLFTWLGFLFAHLLPIGDIAHRTNLMCAILGAGGVAILFLIARRLELSRALAAFTALLFGVSVTFWSQTVITEVYAPNVFMLALTVLLLLEWAYRSGQTSVFFAFALTLGLSLGVHMSNLGFALAYTAFVLLTDWRILKRPLTIFIAFILFVLGAAQFLWVPLRASTITDPLVMRFPPTTLAGFYVYTLGAFSNLRFAFPLTAMPDRIVVYLGYLNQNFTAIGIALGVLGMWAMLFRQPKRFWLFILMYVTNLFFFTQYRVFDLDVFFIPAHFVFAIFIGFGAQQLGDWLRALLARWNFSTRVIALASTLAMILFLFAPVSLLALVSARDNNRKTDTAIGDFYRNVFQMLPANSMLVNRRGVFGYDMYYWQRIYRVRPDVTMPSFGDRRANTNTPLYSTVNVINGEPQGGNWAPPRNFFPDEAWLMPVLVGNQRELVLYRVSGTPPNLFVANAQPTTRVAHPFDGLIFLGYDLSEVADAASPRVHLKTYWRVTEPRTFLIATRVNDLTLETHELGFGNLQHAARAYPPTRDSVLVEEYDLVIPSHLKRGEYKLQIGLADFSTTGIAMDWVNAGVVRVK